MVLCVLFVDVEAQGPRWEPSSIALPIVAEAGALNQTHLTDMASLACQLALESVFLSSKAGTTGAMPETMVSGELNSEHVCVASALTPESSP